MSKLMQVVYTLDIILGEIDSYQNSYIASS